LVRRRRNAQIGVWSSVTQSAPAPDAAQRRFDGALQSRGPRIGIAPSGFLGPGSAQQRSHVAARPGHERGRGCRSHFVIANEAKQIQKSLRGDNLDCFVASAPRNEDTEKDESVNFGPGRSAATR